MLPLVYFYLFVWELFAGTLACSFSGIGFATAICIWSPFFLPSSCSADLIWSLSIADFFLFLKSLCRLCVFHWVLSQVFSKNRFCDQNLLFLLLTLYSAICVVDPKSFWFKTTVFILVDFCMFLFDSPSNSVSALHMVFLKHIIQRVFGAFMSRFSSRFFVVFAGICCFHSVYIRFPPHSTLIRFFVKCIVQQVFIAFTSRFRSHRFCFYWCLLCCSRIFSSVE